MEAQPQAAGGFSEFKNGLGSNCDRVCNSAPIILTSKYHRIYPAHSYGS